MEDDYEEALGEALSGAPLVYDEADPNLVAAFEANPSGAEALEEIKRYVYECFDTDWQGCSELRNRNATLLRLYTGWLKKKTQPWPGASNAHVPVVLENLSRLHARLHDEIFGDWTNVVGFAPVGPDDEEWSSLLSAHTNWQVRNLPGFEEEIGDRALLLFLATGDVVTVSRFNWTTRQNEHRALMLGEDFVMPFAHSSTKPDLSDLPHHTEVLRLYRHELEAMRGQWENVDEVLEREGDTPDDEPDSPTRAMAAETKGEETPTDTRTQPYKLLVWEGWYKLPEQPRHRYCQVIMDHRSRMLLKVAIHEKRDWKDEDRFERERLEADEYHSRRGEWERNKLARGVQAVVLDRELRSMELTGEPNDAVTMASANLLQAQEEPPPPMPTWMRGDPGAEPEPVRKVPVRLYARGKCLPSLGGNYGVGMGSVLAEFNKNADTALQQFNDMAALNNSWTILKPASLSFPKDFTWGPGKIFSFRGSLADDIRSKIVELKAPPANEQLLNMVDRFVQYAEQSVHSPSVLAGQPGKSGETFRGLNTRLEQATKQLGIIARRFVRFLRQLYINNCELNARFMPDEEVFFVTDHLDPQELLAGVDSPQPRIGRDLMKASVMRKAGRALYRRNYSVEVRSDMKFTSEAQRIAEADQIVQMPAAVPGLQMNPRFQYESVKKALEVRGLVKLVNILGAAPPVPAVFGQPPMPPPVPGVPPGGMPQ